MRKLFLSVLVTSVSLGAFAQTSTKTETKPTAKKTTTTKKAKTRPKGVWEKGGNFSLTISQGGSRNWAPGGDRFTLAGNSFLNLYANQTKGKWKFSNTLDANFGLMNSESVGVIKNDDKLEILSKWNVEIGKPNQKGKNRFRLGLTSNFRTQFQDGYDYDGDIKKRISAFLAPGILVLSPGVDYVEVKNFNVHFSPVAGRWILMPNRPYELGPNYGVKPAQQVKNEFGSYLSLGYKGEIMKNVTFRSRFDVFANYVDKSPGNMDLYWTNMLYLKVNKYLGVVYSFDLQYDDDTKIFGYAKNAPRTQLKSIFGVGLNYSFTCKK